MLKTFTETGFEHYKYWQKQDHKTLNKINRLLQSIEREGAMGGEGKPERLKYGNGYSRRIDDKNRLVYKIDEYGFLYIIACKEYY